MKLFELSSQKTVWYGPVEFSSGKPPVYFQDAVHADSYEEQDGLDVVAVNLSYRKAAKNSDIDRINSEHNLNLNFDELSYSQLAQEKDVVNKLKSEGFDCYIDYSIFYNEEPLTAVMFDAIRQVHEI